MFKYIEDPNQMPLQGLQMNQQPQPSTASGLNDLAASIKGLPQRPALPGMTDQGGFGGLGIGNPGSYGGEPTVGAPGATGGANKEPSLLALMASIIMKQAYADG
jgi:hypothetical protein